MRLERHDVSHHGARGSVEARTRRDARALRDLLHGRFRDGYSSAVEVLLQSLVELIQATELEFGHALFLAATSVVGANLVWCRGHVELGVMVGVVE